MKLNLCFYVTITLLIMNALYFQDSNGQTQEIPLRVINVDYRVERGAMNTLFKQCVGAGRANEGLRADWQQQLSYVKKECDFKYIRMHGLLCDEMGIYKEDGKGNPQYNYMYVDALFDFLQSMKLSLL